MNNQEAVAIIIEERRSKKRQIVNANDRLAVGLPDHDSDTEKAVDMAIAAMEKQIPRKAIEYTRYCCPKCGIATNTNTNYCPECGQAIDWSEQFKNHN